MLQCILTNKHVLSSISIFQKAALFYDENTATKETLNFTFADFITNEFYSSTKNTKLEILLTEIKFLRFVQKCVRILMVSTSFHGPKGG